VGTPAASLLSLGELELEERLGTRIHAEQLGNWVAVFIRTASA